MSDLDDLDRPVWGAEQIGRLAGLLKPDGTVDTRKTFYALEEGYLNADKVGRRWTSTPRRIRKFFSGLKDETGWKPNLTEEQKKKLQAA
jgi:hypothetical protein